MWRLDFPLGRVSRRFAGQLVRSDTQRKTIYALSTPPGKAGVAVVRVSGPEALQVFSQLVKPRTHFQRGVKPKPWRMYHCQILHPDHREVLDSGLAVYFAAPRSFTTEDVVELHVHSGRAVIASVLDALSTLPYCRPAEAGEFTRQAFNGGRMDLTEVEGLKDLIDADTESQRRSALRAANGTVRSQFETLRTEAIGCLALVEALIDFGEGEDIEEGVFAHAQERASKLRDTIQAHLSDRRRGEIIRSGIRLAIFGPPNAGKSSLLNFLAQRDAAIVTPIPGTTRDILELSLDLDGVPLVIADTAGIRLTDDLVESIGIERAKTAIQTSDVSLCVLSLPDVTTSPSFNSNQNQKITRTEIAVPASIAHLITPNTFFLLNKSDLASSPPLENVQSVPISVNGQEHQAWRVSLTTGAGTEDFLQNFSMALQRHYDLGHSTNNQDHPIITRARHRVHLESAVRFLDAFLATDSQDIVFGAEELRYAAQAIGKVSGLIDTEDILDALFSEFCIGK